MGCIGLHHRYHFQNTDKKRGEYQLEDSGRAVDVAVRFLDSLQELRTRRGTDAKRPGADDTRQTAHVFLSTR